MYGFQRTVESSINIVSGATFSQAIGIEGATKLFAFLGSTTTGVNFTPCVGNTATTSQLYQLYVMGVTSGASGVIRFQLPTGASQVVCDISQAAGMKYMKFESSAVLTDGGKITLIQCQ
jgi:hypothetical protein